MDYLCNKPSVCAARASNVNGSGKLVTDTAEVRGATARHAPRNITEERTLTDLAVLRTYGVGLEVAHSAIYNSNEIDIHFIGTCTSLVPQGVPKPFNYSKKRKGAGREAYA